MPKAIIQKYYDPETHAFKASYENLYKEVHGRYHAAINKSVIIRILDTWLTSDSLLKIVEGKRSVPMESILYSDVNTKHLFRKYIVVKNQSWSSLSSWQSYELHADVLNYVGKLSKLRRKQVFASLMNTVKVIQPETGMENKRKWN